MSATRHTPGPWKAESGRVPRSRLSDETAWFEIVAEGKDLPVVICNKTQSKRPDETLANANLIAAAPELLAACEAARRFLGDSPAAHLHAAATAEQRQAVDALVALGAQISAAITEARP